MPFCQRHANTLPEPHKKALWVERRKDGVCGACSPVGEGVDAMRSERWNDLFNLGVAILLVVYYDECGAPPEMHDDAGFCWGCGVHDAHNVYKIANKVVVKFGLRRAA